MSPRIVVEILQPKISVLMDQASVFRHERNVPHDWILNSNSVQECPARVTACARNGTVLIVRWTKYQRTRAADRVWAYPADCKRKVESRIDCGLVHIRLDPGTCTRNQILLRVPRESVVGLKREPAIKVVPVSDQETTGLRGLLFEVSLRLCLS